MGFYESTRATHRHRRGPIAAVRSAYFRSLDAVVVPGEAATDALVSMGVSRSRIVEGFNAVDVEFFHSQTNQERRLRGGSASNTVDFDFIYVGQFIERKNLESLLDALREVPEARLLLVGSGAHRTVLEERVLAWGLEHRVFFHPPVENRELPRLFARSRTLVLPSTEEVWGLVVNEGLAAGLSAIVSSAAGVAPSVVGMRGVLVADPHSAGLARAMRESLAASEAPIKSPEILRHTPVAFARQFARALELVQ
ncbi:glycosyltransferase [Microcella alkalica]|uniref:D-inositol 3-phosphate glycosyltransferase n=1 Tax=Microcella alkalica TaxID=355930 RepID=A0A839EEV5_9MICO|nr:glycosyltransferase involved in cell wall biosynthesis [Microcella alkalica]